MKRYYLAVLAAFLLCAGSSLSAQDIGVQHLWGKSIGKAQNDRDFLIYDAVCADNKLFIVGKAESGTGLELKRGENTYFHSKDDYTDAFLACYSLNGELLWSTYLPALEDGYYNAFASTISYITDSNHIVVVMNIYRIQKNLETTKLLIPNCSGKLFILELDVTGGLVRQKTFNYIRSDNTHHRDRALPLIRRFVEKRDVLTKDRFLLGGVSIENYILTHSGEKYIYSFPVLSGLYPEWKEDILEDDFAPTYLSTASTYIACQMVHPNLWNFVNRFTGNKKDSLALNYIEILEEYDTKSTDKSYPARLHAGAGDLLMTSGIYETWNITSSKNTGTTQHYANPYGTRNPHYQFLFPGTIQNIITFNNKYLVQGIHCRNYANGFFKKDGLPYTYSHDTEHLIPKTGGFYQNRNNNHTAVPYLILYDSATLFGTDVSEEDSRVYDYQPPLWGSYLNADWYYEDIFHVTDSAQRKDIYQPYEPALLSNGSDRFFLIGNARSIGNDLIDNLSMTEEVLHHQGVVLAFSIKGCPPKNTAFQDVRFLCPDDSVELKLSPDYAGFKFRFDNAALSDGSVVFNADSSRAWAKKEGTFAATLDGSAFGCPDVTVDTVRISYSPYPEPVSALDPDSTIAACAAAGVVLEAVTAPDTSFSYRWFDGDTVSPKTVRFAYDSLFFASVEVDGYCTSFRDSVRIRFLPPYVALGKDSLLCTSQVFADTSVMMRLTARQDYFPDADWIFRWKINGMDASDNDSLLLRYADLERAGGDLRHALISIAVSLSDADVDGCTAHDTLVFSLVSLPDDSANVFLPQSEILCAHQDIDLFLSKADAYRCFWLDKDSIEMPYGHDTTRFTVQGMRGLDGYGAGTDTREPRFFQLRLDHKLCGVSFFDTLLVYDQVKPSFTLSFHDTLICRNEPVELDSLSPHVYRPFYVFEWNDGEKGSARSFTDSGTYVLAFFVDRKYDFCGYDTATDTLRTVWVDPAMTDIFLPADTTFCKDLSVTLDVRVPFPSTKYSWQDGPMPDEDEEFEEEQDTIIFTSPIKIIKEEGTYNVLLLDTMGCKNRQEIEVTIDDCTPAIEIPNVFTPNGDGVNDVWRFKQLEKCTDVVIEVVDRWGQPVLKKKVPSTDDFEWNGRVNNTGTRLPDGPYFYMVTYKNLYGKSKVQSGSITILGTAE